MTTAIHLCRPGDFDRLDNLVARFHAEMQIDSDADARCAGLMPLLDGSPLGAAWLFGPSQAPSGYVVATFGWSVEFAGMDAFIDEIYVRPSIRGRGIATEVLHAIAGALRDGGIRALHLEVDRDNHGAHRLYAKSGFQMRDRYCLMTRTF